jgi:TatD DNase family protein
MYFDIHSHLHDPVFDADRREVFLRMARENVGTITIGTDMSSSQKAAELAEKEEGVWASVGIHPRDNPNEIFEVEALKNLAAREGVVAIGECGLDYFGSVDPKEKKRQQDLFEEHIDLALNTDLPLMLHVRDAYDDVLALLEHRAKREGERLRGNVHFFAGDTEVAKQFFDIGFSISFTGVITFTHDYDEVVAYAPKDMIMAETDAPYVAPAPFRGKRNEPLYVKEVYKKIAALRGETEESMREEINTTAIRVFGVGLSS